MKQKKIELLAPAGNMESLIAAVSAGADAVYLGVTNFSARAFAGNFNHDEFIQAVKYCHLRGVMVYVTMNTLLFEEEIDNAVKEAGFLYEHDVDALLIQDLGLFHRLRIEYPDLELHCSTQMHIHNPAGCMFMKEQGARRVVLARETPIEVVKQCVQTGVDIEIFAYGALCISYSGQCLMSQSIKNRSGNRGMCAQLCRLRYYPKRESGYVTDPDGEFLLSMKDLNEVGNVPQLIEAGVCSLKIEGRMKRPEYVFIVTDTFRKAIDAYYRGVKFVLDEERRKDLLLMFNRGFTNGHLFHADLSARMSHFRPNHQGVRIGTVLRYENGRVLVKLSAPLYQHDGLRILNTPYDTGLTAVRIYKKGLLVNSADTGEEVWLECKSKPNPKPGQPLQKTSDARLLDNIHAWMRSDYHQVPVTITCIAKVGQPLQLLAEDIDGHVVTSESQQVMEAARSAPLSMERLSESLTKSAEYPFALKAEIAELENVFLPISVLNKTRRDLLDGLAEKRYVTHIRKGHQEYRFSLDQKETKWGRLLGEDRDHLIGNTSEFSDISDALLPVVEEKDCARMQICHKVISQIGSLWHDLDSCIAGMTLNCANSYALAFLLSQRGIEGAVLSSECSNSSIANLLARFEERYGFTPYTWKLVYGRRSLMFIKDGFMKDMPDEMRDMEDRVYPLKKENGLAVVEEPWPYRDENPYCYGSYLILEREAKETAESLERGAYEEISGRV